MIPKLKIIPLGGLGEIGKNMTVIEFGYDMIVIDCGMGFPDTDMYGVETVKPDISYLRANANHILGIILTHGHEDHIGAVAHVLREIDAPIYTTPLTAALVELKLEEAELLYNTQIFTKMPGSMFRLGCFQIEMIHVNHSIPDAVALSISTPLGTIIHTGDWKIDVTPICGKMMDLTRFGELGNAGVLALLSDSTNIEKEGHSVSESKVGEAIEKYFIGCDKRLIITTFASNVHRLQQIINVAQKYNRKVAVTGRSMENILKVCKVTGYMEYPEDLIIDLEQANSLPKNRVVILSTGSQGESMSALHRMAFSEHKLIKIDSNDRILISASAIPGNENMISRVIDELFHKGAEVIYARGTELHVSGHASQEEHKMLMALVRPKYFIPVHGEYRMLVKHAELAKSMGVPGKNIVIAENGSVIEITKKGISCEETVAAGPVLIDSTGIGEIGSVVLNDRHKLADAGMVTIIIPYSSELGQMTSDPEIVTRGFIYVKEAEELMDELKRVTIESVEHCTEQNITDWAAIKSKVKSNITGFIFKSTRKSPIILPVIIET